MTDFTKVCEILGALYINYKEDKEFKDFIDFNDLGLPLAYFVTENLCEVSDDGARYITETWVLFVQSLGLQDIGFETLDQMLAMAAGEEQSDEDE
jgi:hypothetical protein